MGGLPSLEFGKGMSAGFGKRGLAFGRKRNLYEPLLTGMAQSLPLKTVTSLNKESRLLTFHFPKR